jgi:hypothetical protein
VQEAGQIIRAVRQQLAAAEPDEQVEILALDALGGRCARGFGKRGMGDAKWSCVAAQFRQIGEQSRIRRAPEQRRDQRIFLSARCIHVIDVAGHFCVAVKIGPQDRAIDAGDGLDRDHPFCGNACPVGHGRLGNTDLARKFADAADGA